MTFPGAGAQVYYNEAGEPTGWDYPGYDEGPDPDDFDDPDDYDDEPDEDDEQGEPEEDEPEVDHNALAAQLATKLEARGLRLRYYGDGVINIERPGPEYPTNEDLDAFRVMLRECRYVEVESWVARQGVSWLSDGLPAGVSFRVRPAS